MMDKNIFLTQIGIYLPLNIRSLFDAVDDGVFASLSEIRLTIASPLYLEFGECRRFLGKHGITNNFRDAYPVDDEDISRCVELITKSSVYAYNHYINEGFLTLPGGHRVGLVGTCVMEENRIISVKNINSLNFRISHYVRGASELIFDDIYNNKIISNTLIVSPPGCGKTTILKDIIRSLNDQKKTGKIVKCAIIDERFELFPMSLTTAMSEQRTSTSVIYGCPKSTAIPILVRSMSPDVIIVDELATVNDISAIRYAKASGCSLIASTHGRDEINNEINLSNAMNVFDKVVILSGRRGPGTVEKIIGGDSFD